MKSFSGQNKDLSIPEQFLYALSQVPRVQIKIAVAQYIYQFKYTIQEINDSVDSVIMACDQVSGLTCHPCFDMVSNFHSFNCCRCTTSQVLTSVSLRRTFESLLLVGNTINQDTPRGNAYGFQVDSLQRFSEVRSTNRPSEPSSKIEIE